MKILNLFFIQFSLCYGIELLPIPGDIPDHEIIYQPSIEGMTNEVMRQLFQLSSTAFDAIRLPTENDIIQRVDFHDDIPNHERNIDRQYTHLNNALLELNYKYLFIHHMITDDSESNPSHDYGDLINRNVQMQNIITSAMIIIKNFVNFIIENQNPPIILNHLIQRFGNRTRQIIQNQRNILTRNQRNTLNEIRQIISTQFQQFNQNQNQQIILTQNQRNILNQNQPLILEQSRGSIINLILGFIEVQIQGFINFNQNQGHGGQNNGQGGEGRGQGGHH